MSFTPDQATRIFLGLGANLGNRELNLREAVGRIKVLGLEVIQASSIYETEPVGYTEQEWFLNQVIEVRFTERFPIVQPGYRPGETGLDEMIRAEELLRALQEIEKAMGRARPFANAPRAIDIDLLLFGDRVLVKDISSETPVTSAVTITTGLVVPHPRLHLRRFVLVPLNEIAPEVTHPSLHKPISALLAECADRSVVRLYQKTV